MRLKTNFTEVWSKNMKATGHGLGGVLTIDSKAFATTLLLETLASWPEMMLPHFTSKAQSQWGNDWELECAKLLSGNMKQHFGEGGGWDAYRIVSVMMKKMAIFMPDYDKLSDCARELHRHVLIRQS